MIVRTYYCDRCKEEVEKEGLTEIIRHGGGYLHLCPSCDKELEKLISEEKPKRKYSRKLEEKPKRKYTKRTEREEGSELQITMSEDSSIKACAKELAMME